MTIVEWQRAVVTEMKEMYPDLHQMLKESGQLRKTVQTIAKDADLQRKTTEDAMKEKLVYEMDHHLGIFQKEEPNSPAILKVKSEEARIEMEARDQGYAAIEEALEALSSTSANPAE